MTVGIVGLGLIGGSFAKAYHETGATVLAWNRSRSVLDFAVMSGTVDAELTEENIASCDLVLIALYPEATIDWFRRMAPHIGPHPVVLDCGGTKRTICAACFPIAEEYGVTFLGGHPMAGTQFSGFKNAKANMYHGAPMVIVPPDFDDVLLFDRVKQLLKPAGFSRFSFTTAEAHDEMIAFTSQMAHVVSNAYIKSPTADQHKGFSAGSYKDMTRVAWLSPEMWAELFLENKDNLLHELDVFMAHLNEYRDAMAHDDLPTLTRLLDEGRRRKEEVDG
ncbi:MAG: prephenate dehydrogenase [Oscillospiraceae bacterium]